MNPLTGSLIFPTLPVMFLMLTVWEVVSTITNVLSSLTRHRILTFMAALTNTFSYKGFELSFLFSYQFGNYIYDQSERQQSYAGTEKKPQNIIVEWLDKGKSNECTTAMEFNNERQE